jgi:Tfp pilus assembly protein PilZ
MHGMRFPSAADFLAVFRRDLVNGGLFVPSGDPAGLYERVVVSLHLPEPVKRVFKVEARVVQVIEPRPGPDGGRTGGGMGLELIDVDRVLEELRPLVKLLEG